VSSGTDGTVNHGQTFGEFEKLENFPPHHRDVFATRRTATGVHAIPEIPRKTVMNVPSRRPSGKVGKCSSNRRFVERAVAAPNLSIPKTFRHGFCNQTVTSPKFHSSLPFEAVDDA